MDDFDLQALTEKYRDAVELYPLQTGGSVVGQEIDSDNRLIYVIREDDGTIRMGYATDERPIPRILPDEGISHVVTVDRSQKSE